MQPAPQTSKLEELRAKTDRQLRGLATRALDRGLAAAEEARDRYALGESLSGNHLAAAAGRAHDDLRMLLPLLAGISRGEYARLEAAGRQLQAKLDELQQARPSTQCACCR